MKLLILLAATALLSLSVALPAAKLQEEKVPTKMEVGLNQLAKEMARDMNEVSLAKMEKFAKMMSRCDYNELVRAMAQAVKSDYRLLKMMNKK